MRLFSPIALLSLVFSGSVMFLLDFYGVWLSFLSHPFWSTKANLIGIGIGLVVAAILLWMCQENFRRLLISSVLTFLLAGALFSIAIEAKEIFAASYAENRLAGKVWYFSFIGMIGTLFAAFSLSVTCLLAYLSQDQQQEW